MSPDGNWHDVAALDDVPEECGLAVQVAGVKIALFRDGETIVATEDYCPHRGGQLAEGIVRDGVVVCPLHAWAFRLQDGENVDGGPGIKVYPVQVAAGRVQVQA
jgi:NAD(P)H-dependent nitrite reductase small subunit